MGKHFNTYFHLLPKHFNTYGNVTEPERKLVKPKLNDEDRIPISLQSLLSQMNPTKKSEGTKENPKTAKKRNRMDDEPEFSVDSSTPTKKPKFSDMNEGENFFQYSKRISAETVSVLHEINEGISKTKPMREGRKRFVRSFKIFKPSNTNQGT